MKSPLDWIFPRIPGKCTSISFGFANLKSDTFHYQRCNGEDLVEKKNGKIKMPLKVFEELTVSR